jgi:Synergist-CTERM protein sorting domain-containing protein
MGLSVGTAVITVTTPNGRTATCNVTVFADTDEPATSGVVNRITLSRDGPYRAGSPFDIRVGLSSVPASVRIDVLRPDWQTDSFTARIEGLTAWIAYTPPQEGTYTVTATALSASNTVVGSGLWSFVVGGGSSRSGSSGGGCNAGMVLLALALVPAIGKMRKGK